MKPQAQQQTLTIGTRASVLECGGPPPLWRPPHLSRGHQRATVLARPKTRPLVPLCVCFLLSAFYFQAWSQYSIDWFSVDGGGGASTGGTYTLTGTIGQPDAGAMSGGNFTLVGGFWSAAAAIQTPGAPYLILTRSNNAVVLSWPKADPAWQLEFTTGFVSSGPNSWTLIPPPYPTNATDCVVAEPSSLGNKFYRLHKP
jgi:hypothetical protein